MLESPEKRPVRSEAKRSAAGYERKVLRQQKEENHDHTTQTDFRHCGASRRGQLGRSRFGRFGRTPRRPPLRRHRRAHARIHPRTLPRRPLGRTPLVLRRALVFARRLSSVPRGTRGRLPSAATPAASGPPAAPASRASARASASTGASTSTGASRTPSGRTGRSRLRSPISPSTRFFRHASRRPIPAIRFGTSSTPFNRPRQPAAGFPSESFSKLFRGFSTLRTTP